MSSSSTAVSNMQTHAIVLFDVDGTVLVSAGAETEAESSNNVHKQSVTYAIEHVMGIKGASVRLSYAMMHIRTWISPSFWIPDFRNKPSWHDR